MDRPSFATWMADNVGPTWVVARRTKRNMRRYSDETRFLSVARFAILKREYETKWGPIY